MGASALEEPYNEDQHQSFYPTDDELSARVREALRADSSTSEYADRVRIITRGTVVVLRGVVVDLDDSDNLAAVAAYVEGVDEVIDELKVQTLE
jgi:osmotically-inducible protein OsmY